MSNRERYPHRQAGVEPTVSQTVPNSGGGDRAAPKPAANPMSRKTQIRKPTASGLRLRQARPVQNAQQNYERYLELARAQALTGDHIAAENYLQHAEHYLRSMRENGQAAPAARK